MNMPISHPFTVEPTCSIAINLVLSIKGGAGKSILAECLHVTMDHMKLTPPVLVDADIGIPDFSLAHRDEILRTDVRRYGFSEVIDQCDEHPTRPFLVVTGANELEAVSARIEELAGAAHEMGRPFRVFWPIDLTRDSFMHMKDLMGLVPTADLYVVRNHFFGDREEFKAWDMSATKRELGIAPHRDLDLPRMPKELATRFKDDRLSLVRVKNEGKRSERWGLEIYLRKLIGGFGPVLTGRA